MRFSIVEILFTAALFSGLVGKLMHHEIGIELLTALFCVIIFEVKNYLNTRQNVPLDELRQEIEQLKSDVSALRISQGFRGD